jgi:hypothetical protein
MALKIWNGRWAGDGTQHIYAAAHSRADLIRMIGEYLGHTPRGMNNEIHVYWQPDCWGTPMDGIKVERGLWIQSDSSKKPKRVWPKNANQRKS